MENKSQREWFKEAYDLGEDRVKSGCGWPMEVDSYIKESFKIINKDLKTGKVLDIGCGQGRNTIFFAEKGFNSFGVDYVERAIKEARESADKKKLSNANFKVMDILNLKFSKNYFDVLIDSSVFDHVHFRDWDSYLKNTSEVLRKGGYFIMSEFSANDPRIEKERHLYEHKEKPFPESLYFENKHHYDHYFSEKELRKIFFDNYEFIKIKEVEHPQRASKNPPRVMINMLMRKK